MSVFLTNAVYLLRGCNIKTNFSPQGIKGEPGLPGRQVLVTPEVRCGYFLENDQESDSRTKKRSI